MDPFTWSEFWNIEEFDNGEGCEEWGWRFQSESPQGIRLLGFSMCEAPSLAGGRTFEYISSLMRWFTSLVPSSRSGVKRMERILSHCIAEALIQIFNSKSVNLLISRCLIEWMPSSQFSIGKYHPTKNIWSWRSEVILNDNLMRDDPTDNSLKPARNTERLTANVGCI